MTSLTGFLFPFRGVTPGIVIGVLSIPTLIVAVVALCSKQLSGGWRGTYLITAMLAKYFNFVVLIVQSFEKVPALHALAPTQSEGRSRLRRVSNRPSIGGAAEKIADLKDWHDAGWWGRWMDLDPTDAPCCCATLEALIYALTRDSK